MASSSDGRRGRIRYRGMEQPPLIRMLKTILSEYPDGGQILKELIQNAEDAGARNVKLMFDCRQLNDTTEENAPKFSKFFKAPALCVYNDAVFSDDDWNGIQMIYSSVKEKEKMKVGKFGLGFKSVFHMTDYPSVISGDFILMVDPHQPSDMVNSMVSLCDVNNLEDEGLDADHFWDALDGTFSFKRTDHPDKFPGTLFWFPLREKKSDLSETLYNEQKINDLFESFENEADKLMIFMKSLERISLHRRDNNRITDVMTVEIGNAEEQVRTQRDEFSKLASAMASNIDEDDVHCFIPMTIHLQSPNRDEITNWYVVNYLVNKSASETFKQMIEDEDKGKCPYVGVAVPMNREIQGHIFCFLPLPQEGETLTGLPVHINGFFELSQNRHNLKWDTDEHSGKPTDDRCILWNKALIEEALPNAYLCLIEGALKCMPKEPDKVALKGLYNMLPVISSSAQKRWTSLSDGLFKRLETHRFIYSQTHENWFSLKEVCFATFPDVAIGDESQKGVRESILSCLKAIDTIYAEIPDKLLDTFRQQFRYIRELDARMLVSYLKQKTGYQKMCDADKMNILSYLLSDNVCWLDGIRLLPLDDGSWSEFSNYGPKTYLCTDDEEANMFPGLGHKIVRKRSEIGSTIYNKLKDISQRGMYQIEHLTAETTERLLMEVLSRHFVGIPAPSLSNDTILDITWLKIVWEILQRQGNLGIYKHVSLVPVLQRGSWSSSPVVKLHKLSELLLLTDNGNLPHGLTQCLEAFSVIIIPSLPGWINRKNFMTYAYDSTSEGIISLLNAASGSNGNGVHQFNCLPEHVTNALKQFLIKNWNISPQTVATMKQLKFFQAKSATFGSSYRRSVSETSTYIAASDLVVLPRITLPKEMIIAGQDEEHLLSLLGAQRYSLSTIVRDVIQTFTYQNYSNPFDDKSKTMVEFMNFVVSNFDRFQSNTEITDIGKTIPFLVAQSKLYKPCQLFSPLDKDLRGLLQGQSMFPERQQGYSDKQVHALSMLGLKSGDQIDENILLQVATECHRLSSMPDACNNNVLRQKSTQMMKIICEKPHLLLKNKSKLLKELNNLNWVLLASKPPYYPTNVPWFSDGKIVCKPCSALSMQWALFVGAGTNIVECQSKEVIEHFKWNDAPESESLISQLEILDQHYELQFKPEYLPVVQKIYNFISSHSLELHNLKVWMENRRVIWTGAGFQVPKKVIVNQRPGDIDLKPFYFTITEEFATLQDMFLMMGCQPFQDNTVLSQTLAEVQKNDYKTYSVSTDTETIRKLVINVLQKLSSNLQGNLKAIQQLDLLMMVENDDDEYIDLQPISCCILDDDEDLEGDTDLKFVHEGVPRRVAVDLGLQSARSKTLTEAVGAFQPWGQTEPLTKRIETLLKRDYRFGLGVPKELIQNADDAGATVVKFMFDERLNENARDKLFRPSMAECQGSALWVYNNETFTPKDLDNIILLNGGTKANDDKTIGKFGLGFCAVYNLTELPCFISGGNLIIFDPQQKYLDDLCKKDSPGVKVNLTNRRKHRLIKDNIDQFKPFSNVFGCNIDATFNGFDGTLFRFPLRTSQQAVSSKLSQEPCLREHVVQLLSTIIENAGSLLLFTQNVSCIQIYHIPERETDPSNADLIFEITKSTTMNTADCVNSGVQNVLTRLHDSATLDLSEVHHLIIKQRLMQSQLLPIPRMPYVNETSWLISWNSPRASVPLQSSRKYLPISAIALPVSKDKFGHVSPMPLQETKYGFDSCGLMFCFLPLPIKTEVPFHINGCFEVSADRKRLEQCTSDEIGGHTGGSWNQLILEKSTVASFIQLLEYLSSHCSTDYKYYSLWPTQTCNVVNDFRRGFFRALIGTKARLFQSKHGWHNLDEVIFLHPDVTRQDSIHSIAFDMIDSFPVKKGKHIVEAPTDLYDAFRECVDESSSVLDDTMISEADMIKHFLDIISDKYWMDKISSRNKLIRLALQSDNIDILNKMKEIPCIPSLPAGILRKPCELVDPTSVIAGLFTDTDGYFPIEEDFRSNDVLSTLQGIGMMYDTLPNDLLIDRCHTVSEFGKRCCYCSRERCTNVIKYISHKVSGGDIKEDMDIVESLRHIPILPILSKPSTWSFTWASDNIDGHFSELCREHSSKRAEQFQVGSPSKLYREKNVNCIGSLELLVDETFLHSVCGYLHSDRLCKVFQVQNIVSPDLLRKQLLCLANEYKDKDRQFICLQKCHEAIYENLVSLLHKSDDSDSTEETIRKLFDDIRNEKILLIGHCLVAPNCVAFSVKYEYPPYLCRLSAYNDSARKLYSLVGVSEVFSSMTILDTMKAVKAKWSEVRHIDAVVRLLQNLCESMDNEQTTYCDLGDLKKFVYAPDTTGSLYSTSDLVIQDENFSSKVEMHYLHGEIPPILAQKVGVKSKIKHVVTRFSKLIGFGQKEHLATRLKGLLEDYPCDSSVLKELLQNADDAKASELHFIKDFRKNLPLSNNTFGGSRAFQSPALCIFNNSYFTEADFNGIKNLGEGSKRRDPTTTGRFGIGFNTVYHLTDSPSFFTVGPGLGANGTLCIFDPLLKTIPEYVSEDEPGIKCDVEEMIESFPDILDFYLAQQSIFDKQKGTLFRLPLRQEKSEISDEIISEETVDAFVEEMKQDLFDMLLFLKHVKKIKISSINDDGELTEEYCVESSLSGTATNNRNSFFTGIKNEPNKPRMIDYRMDVTDSCGAKAMWLIVQKYGLGNDSDAECTQEDFTNFGICQLPLGAIALPVINENLINTVIETKPIDKQEDKKMQMKHVFDAFEAEMNALKKFGGKSFCLLPIKGMTKLKFHYNGHFVLDKARLHIDQLGMKGKWNKMLLKDVVTKAWIHGMMKIKEDIDTITRVAQDWSVVNKIMAMFSELLPSKKSSYQGFHALLCEYIYTSLVKERVAIMPVVMCSRDVRHRGKLLNNPVKIAEKQNFCIEWTAVATEEFPLDGVFNNIKDVLSKQNTFQVGFTLKMVGMKLIEQPISVHKSIKSYGIKALDSSPDTVVHFLRTYTDDDPKSCNIGCNIEDNSPVTETLLMSAAHVNALVQYIVPERKYLPKPQEVNPIAFLTGLPLSLTWEQTIHTFSTDSPVYWSVYAKLCPKSLSLFMNKCLMETLVYQADNLRTAGIVKPFGADDLLELLPLSYNGELLKSSANVPWDKKAEVPLTAQFLKSFYAFLHEQSRKLTSPSGVSYTDTKELKLKLMLFKDWAFIPSVQGNEGHQVFELIPISSGEKVLAINNSCDEKLGIVLKKLNTPVLDTSVIDCYETKRVVEHAVATLMNPCSFLRYLSFYKDRIASCDLVATDGQQILEFFEQHVAKLDDEDAVRMLKSLPIFETMGGELKDLCNNAGAFVLSDDIPKDGLLDWSHQTNTILLVATACNHVYEKLNLKVLDNFDFYTKYLLPKISDLPLEFLFVHIVQIRDAVFPRTFGSKRNQVVQILAKLPFIQVHGKYRQVNELFVKENPVYRVMLDDSIFLPERFLDEKWFYFLSHLGLNVNVSSKQLVDFAKQIASNGVYRVSDQLRTQIKELLRLFIEEIKKWGVDTLNEIKCIKFLLPHKVNAELQSIHRQFDDGERLVCFDEGVTYLQEKICWTSMNVLPYPVSSLEIPKALMETLGIHNKPPMSRVISHCQNICESVHQRLQRHDTINVQLIQDILKAIYDYFLRNIEKIGREERQRLAYTHLIFVPLSQMPEEIILVKTSDVVVELKKAKEIRPYLWRIPEELNRFRDVFLCLGSDLDVKCSHYISVLRKMRQEFPDQIPPQQMEKVAQCLRGFVKILENGENTDLPQANVILYLPDRNKRLIKSSVLIISDNDSFEQRIQSYSNFDFFIGFHELGITEVSDPAGPFRKLCDGLRPRLLTNLVEEVVCLDSLTSESNVFAGRLQSFLRCPELIQGIIRLIKHQQGNEKLELEANIEGKLTAVFKSICVEKVSGLKTVMKIDGNTVPNSCKAKTCFIQQTEAVKCYKLLFQLQEGVPNPLAQIMDEDDGLLDLIDKCTNGIMKKQIYKHLNAVMREMQTPSRISAVLDEKQIAAYNLPYAVRTPCFPSPGTYVPEHFFPFLNPSISPFREDEFRFVAYDVGEFNDTLDVYDEVYIYVHILRQINSSDQTLSIEYEIDIGEETTMNVPIHRLFKFYPQSCETSTDVVLFDDEAVGAVPFDENCRRIREMLIDAWSKSEEEKRRVIKRLRLKWHPDRCHTNKDYASKVFNYIYRVIVMLENNWKVTDQCDHPMTDAKKSSYLQLLKNVTNTGSCIAQGWRNDVGYYQAGNLSRVLPVCRDVGNAKRWHRQAKHDFLMAQASYKVAPEPVKGYNWICYNCHQACEKSLKGAGFAKDANNVQRNSHSLSSLASNLSNVELTRLVGDLERNLGSYFGLRYPDAYNRDQIPSDAVTEQQATSALEITKKILDIIEEMIYG